MTRASSITARLTLFFAAASAAVLLVFGHLVGTLVAAHFEAQDLEQLRGKLELVRHALARADVMRDAGTLRRDLDAALVGHHELSVEVLAADGERIYASETTSHAPSLVARPAALDAAGRPLPIVVEHRRALYRGIIAPVDRTGTMNAPVTVALALDISHHRDFLDGFHVQLWIAIAAAVAIAALFGWLAARGGLAPLRAMARIAGDVSASHLTERLPVEGVPRELTGLARAFNGMLARLEASFRRLSEFSSDLAHEFRTPIGNLMMQTEVALSKARSADEYREVLYSNLEELERLARTIGDMLFLAQADHGLRVPHPEEVDLAAETRGLFAFYDVLAEDRGIGLSLVGHGSVRGDRLMLRRALGNLLSNAIRHAQPPGTVTVTVERRDDGELVVGVCNPGLPIPPEHLSRVFERFYRVDASRVRVGEGAGLGLAITKSIVEAHGATIAAACTGGRTCFEIHFPAGAATRQRGGDTPRHDDRHPASAPETPGL